MTQRSPSVCRDERSGPFMTQSSEWFAGSTSHLDNGGYPTKSAQLINLLQSEIRIHSSKIANDHRKTLSQCVMITQNDRSEFAVHIPGIVKTAHIDRSNRRHKIGNHQIIESQ